MRVMTRHEGGGSEGSVFQSPRLRAILPGKNGSTVLTTAA